MKINRSISITILAGSFILLVVAVMRINHHGEVYDSTNKDILTVRSPNQGGEKEEQEPVEVEKPRPALAGMVGKNSSFFDLMSKGGISASMIDHITRKSKKVFNFRKIYPGQHYQLYTDSLGNFKRLEFAINDESYIEVELKEDDIQVKRQSYPFEVEEKIASGMIKSSLFATIKQQSIPMEVGMKMVDIYAWDIDFFTDLRKNDYFRVIYEEKTRFDGLKKIGRITAAEFNTKGKSHYAFLYEGDDKMADYYDKSGNSLRKQLLKAPLSYSRISSSYSRRRYHPVLHRYMPHYGIDYAAPPGTPVMSTGDGTVIVASYRRGNGNYVKLRHNSNYITYYLHLSKFARGITRGAKVKQGQVIGYVGSTGYSTGPHLDYRVKKNGRFVNPRLLELPPAEPVKAEEMQYFLALRERYIEKLGEIAINQERRETYYASEGKGSPWESQNSRNPSLTTKHSTSN
jgi:murein DD-endopeptidase MepM/ murein hydrolase activator NlpD